MKKSCGKFLPHFPACIWQQQNTPVSDFLLELTNANQIVRQRLPAFYPANSLNRAPPCSIEQGFTNAFKTRTTKLLTNINFGSKLVFKNRPLFCREKGPNPLNYFSEFAVYHSISSCRLAVHKFCCRTNTSNLFFMPRSWFLRSSAN